jgi:hypothetical protein
MAGPKVAAEGPQKPDLADPAAPFVEAGEAITGAVKGIGGAIKSAAEFVIDPPALRRQREGLPLQPPDAGFEADKATAAADVAGRQAQIDEISNFDVTGRGGIQRIPTRPRSVNEALAGSGAPTQIGTSSTSRTRSAATPEMLQDFAGAIDFESRAVAAQGDAKAAGLGLKSNLYQDLRLDQQEEVFPILQEAHKIFDDANRQLVGIQELADDVRSNRINPGQFFANIGEAGTFAASMAVAAGHLASAMGGGPNTALAVINGAIERNMRAQDLNQAHDRAALTAQIAIFDRMRGLGIDRLNQANVYNGLLLSQAQSSLEAIAAATASVEARAQIGIIQAQLAQRKQEVFMRAAGSITSTHQMKLFALTSSAQQTAKADVRKGAADILQQSQGRPVEESLDLLRQYQFQNKVQFSDDLIADIKRADPATFGSIPTPQFRVPSDTDVIKFKSAVTGDSAELFPNQRFLDLKETGPDSQEKIRQKLEGQFEYAENWKRIFEIATEIQSTPGLTGFKGILFEGPDGLQVRGAGADSALAQELVNRANRAVVLQAIATQGQMEAIRGPNEWQVLMKKTGLPTDPEQFINMFTSDSAVSLFLPGVRTVLQETARDIAKFTQ